MYCIVSYVCACSTAWGISSSHFHAIANDMYITYIEQAALFEHSLL